MGKLKKLFGAPKQTTPQYVIDAENRAKEAEAKTAAEALQKKMDEEYKAKKQRGKASTILTGGSETGTTDTTRTLLGG